jgi:hypothetical protein
MENTAQSIRLTSCKGAITSTAYNSNKVQYNLIILASNCWRSFFSVCERTRFSVHLFRLASPPFTACHRQSEQT